MIHLLLSATSTGFNISRVFVLLYLVTELDIKLAVGDDVIMACLAITMFSSVVFVSVTMPVNFKIRQSFSLLL